MPFERSSFLFTAIALAVLAAVHCGGGQPFGAAVDSSGLDAVNVDERFYNINGNSVEELRARMEAAGPAGPDGRMFGRCVWRVRASFAGYPRKPDGLCVVTQVPARLDATITLPRWTGYDSAPAELRARWDAFYAGLKRHEHNHLNHGLAAAVETRRRIRELSAKYDCQEFSRRAQAILNEVPAAYAQKDREYDAATGHGTTEFSF